MDCEGDRHECPVLVPEGDSDTARELYGQPGGWVCFQPGKMNADFTEWRCGRGHVITRAHVPGGHGHTPGICHLAEWGWKCPWPVLEGAV
jgi:hypothetical protein